MKRAVALAALLLSTAAAAGSRTAVVVAPFTGPSARKVQAAVKEELCSTATCTKTPRGNAVLTGRVLKSRGKWVVELKLHRDGEAVMQRSLPLSKRFVPKGVALASARSLIVKRLNSREEEREEEVTPSSSRDRRLARAGPAVPRDAPTRDPAGDEEESEDEPTSRKKTKRESEEVASADDELGGSKRGADESDSRRSSKRADHDTARSMRTSGDAPVEGVEQALPREERRPGQEKPLFAFSAGTRIFSRQFRYERRATEELIPVPGGVSIAPEVRVELFPFSRSGTGLAGLGVQGSFARSFGQNVKLSDGRQFGYTVQEWDAGLAWRVLPFGPSGLAFSPQIGGRGLQFAVRPDANGSRPSGLPNTDYLSWRAGFGLDAPLGQRLRVFADAAYHGVVSSGELVSAGYFSRARGFGITGRAGVAVRVISALEISASGGYDLYVHSFQADPGDLYVAAGAQDSYLSGTLALRLML